MLKVLIGSALILLLSACNSIKMTFTPKIQPATKDSGYINAGLISLAKFKPKEDKSQAGSLSLDDWRKAFAPEPLSEVEVEKYNKEVLTSLHVVSEDQTKLLKEFCGEEKFRPRLEEYAKGGGAIALAMPPVVKLAFDVAMDGAANYAKDLKERATNVYSVGFTTSTSKFKEARCLYVARYNDEQNLTFMSVMEIKEFERFNDHYSFVLSPVYTFARNSFALTRCTDNCFGSDGEERGKISVSLGVSLKGVSSKDGSLKVYGNSVITTSGIPLNGAARKFVYVDGNSRRIEEAPLADPIIIPNNGNLLINMAVTETGDVGFNTGRAESELSAIKAAMGPVASSVVKARVEED